jgi:uncharacterized protein (DUF885 family)
MRHGLGLGLGVALLLGATPLFAAPTADDQRFDALAAREYAWRRESFQSAEYEKGGVPAHLSDESLKNQDARTAYWEDVLRDLNAIRAADLSPGKQEDYAVYRTQIEAFVDQQHFRDYEKPLNSDSAFWSDIAFVARDPLKKEQDYVNLLSMMRDIPIYFDQQTANMKAGLKRGFTPPAVTMVGRDKSIAAIAEAKSAEDIVWYEPFKAMPASIAPTRQAELRAEALRVINAQVIPTYAKLLAFMRKDYIPGMRKPLAAESLPYGKAYYQAKIREFTTLDLTPDQIHQIGLDEVKAIRAQMDEVMKEVKFAGDFPAFLHFLRTDPQFYPKTPAALLERAAWISKQFDGKAARWFGRMPRGRFGIVEVPPDIAPYYTAGRGGRDTYLLNTYDLPSRPFFQLTALTLHESAPGHSWQGSLAAENDDRPDYRRHYYISAYGEGWALYCEKLGVEMGMYQTPYDRFGMLSYQMWRAARLVIDTGIHSKGWTRAQAIAFLKDNSALSEHEIETEVDRYIGWPGQALSYYLGERAIVQERARAEKALGTKFDIRAFHDMILSLGSVPLPVITARTDRFIAEGGKGPWPIEN